MKKATRFLETFVSEYIEIITDMQTVQSMKIDSEGNITDGPPIPMIVNGFLLDCDDTFVYLSSSGETVDQAIPLDSIKHVQIVEIKSELDSYLDTIPDPEKETDYN